MIEFFFSKQLSLQELETQYEQESASLQAVRDKMLEQEKARPEIEAKFDEEMQPELHAIIKEVLQRDLSETIDEDDKDYKNVVDQIRNLLEAKEYREAVELIIRLDEVNSADLLAIEFEQRCLYYLALLKSYLFNSYDDEYEAKERLVIFLFDSMEFSQIITRAVPKIEELLMSRNNTDVLEAIEFFTAGYFFNIRGTENGMRRMLSLIWTGEKEKRNAVTNAYNRILFQTDLEGR